MEMTRDKALEIVNAEMFGNATPRFSTEERLAALDYLREASEDYEMLKNIRETFNLTYPQVREAALLFTQYGKPEFKATQERLATLDYIEQNSTWKPKKDCVSIFGGIINFSIRVDVEHFSMLDKIFHLSKK